LQLGKTMVLRRSRKTGSTPPWTELSGELCRERSQISIHFLARPQFEFCAGYLSLP
jgi:hypothetical protein